MINFLFKSLTILFVTGHLISCSSSPTHAPSKEKKLGELMLEITPNKPEQLDKITCLNCDLETENSAFISFFKNPKPMQIDISSIFDLEGEVYSGFKYELNSGNQAIVFGHDYLQGGIDFYLVIWNNEQSKFVSDPMLVSGARGDAGEYDYIESTIIDINDDQVLDLVTNYYTLYTLEETVELENNLLEIYTFKMNKFEMTQGSEEQINRFKTESFSCPERKSDQEVRVMLDSIQGVANCGCDQLKTAKGISDMFSGFEAMYNNRFLADDVLKGEVIDGYYDHLHLCEYLLLFGCEGQWLQNDEFYYHPKVLEGYKRYKESDFLYFADFYRILDRNEFALTGEVGGYLEEIVSENQYLEQFEGY